MKNMKIRDSLLKHRMYQYELAKILNVSEFTLIRRLRNELPEMEQNRIVKIIEEHCRGEQNAE